MTIKPGVCGQYTQTAITVMLLNQVSHLWEKGVGHGILGRTEKQDDSHSVFCLWIVLLSKLRLVILGNNVAIL